MSKRLLMVDDHEVVRAGMKQILADCMDLEVVAEAESGSEALALLRSHQFDGVLLDISMPDRSGVDVLRQIRAEYPELPILILSMHAEEQYAINVLKAGAQGYLNKTSTPDEMRTAIRTVVAGRKYMSPALAQHFAHAFISEEQTALHEQLSPREFEVFCKLAAGQSVSVIAAELFLSVKTVSTHRSRILQKMNFKSNADLTYYAIKNHLIE